MYFDTNLNEVYRIGSLGDGSSDVRKFFLVDAVRVGKTLRDEGLLLVNIRLCQRGRFNECSLKICP